MLPEDQKRILGYFIEEAKDHLNTIEQGLLNLQATIEDPEMVNEVFRAAHSVKGGAAMLGLESIQQTSHRLEDYFKILKESPLQADRTLESMLLQVFDALQEQLEQLQGPFGLTDDKAQEILTAVEPVFEQVHQHLERLVQTAAAVPVRRPVEQPAVPVPMVATPPAAMGHSETSALQLVFKSDVPAYLRNMLGLFKQADNEATRQEIQGVCQQLSRIGEQFELPAWCALVDAARRVIGNEQQTFRTLAPLIIKEIKSGQDLVLAGQSSRITVSLAMQDLLPSEPREASFEEESLDALLEEALSDSLEEADLTDLFANAEVEQEVEGLALPNPDIWLEAGSQTETTADSDLDLASVFEDLGTSGTLNFETDEPPMPILGTGPEVGAAELNSLADLFEGEVSELDEVWEEEEIAEIALEDIENATSDISSEGEFADLLLTEEDADALNAAEGDDELASLFGSTLLDEQASALPELEADEFAIVGDWPLGNSASSSAESASPQDVSDSGDGDSNLEDLWGNTAPNLSASDDAVTTEAVELDFFLDASEQSSADSASPQESGESVFFDDFFAETSSPQPASEVNLEPLSAIDIEDTENRGSITEASFSDVDVSADLWDEGSRDASNVSAELEEVSQGMPDSGIDLAFDDLDPSVLEEVDDFAASLDFGELSLTSDSLSPTNEDDISLSDRLDFGSFELDAPEDTVSANDDFSDALGLLGLDDDPILTGPTAEISDFDLGEVADNLEDNSATAPLESLDFGFDDLDLEFSEAEGALPTDDLLGTSGDIDLSAGADTTDVPDFDLEAALTESSADTADSLTWGTESADVDDLEDTEGLDLNLDLSTDSPASEMFEDAEMGLPASTVSMPGDLGESDLGFAFNNDADSDFASIFGAESAPAAASEEDRSTLGEEADELDFGSGLDFDLDLDEATPTADSDLAFESDANSDFENAFGAEAAAAGVEYSSAPGLEADELDFGSGLDFDLDLDEATPTAEGDLAFESDASSDFENAFGAEAAAASVEDSSAPGLEADELDFDGSLDFDLDLDEANSSSDGDLGIEPEFDLELGPDLGGNLKLDLSEGNPPEAASVPEPSLESQGDEDFFLGQRFDELPSDAANDLAWEGPPAEVADGLDFDSFIETPADEVEPSADNSLTGDISEDLSATGEALPQADPAVSNLDLVDSFFDVPEVTSSAAATPDLTEDFLVTAIDLENLIQPETEESLTESFGDEGQIAGEALSEEQSIDLELFGLEVAEAEALGIEVDFLDQADLSELESEDPPSDVEAGLDAPNFAVEFPALETEADADFDDLDLLLDDELALDSEPDQLPSVAIEESNDLSDDFSDLDALLEAEASYDSNPAGNFSNDFSDLDALLEEGGSDGSSSAGGFVGSPDMLESPLNNSDDEFEDLEKLLEEADQLGGSAPAMGLRRSQAAAARRLPRRSGVLADQTMRVSVKHLDNLSNLVGELVVNRNSLEQDQERLRQFLDNLLFQVQQLNDVGQRMRDLYERSLLESSLISSRQAFQTAAVSDSSHATGITFDALEMDRFTGFHTLSQEMIELIVRVRESSSDIAFTIESTDQITRQFRQVTTQLQEGLNKARMVPFAQTADRLPRAVRDISLKCGKEAKLVVEGRDTLIDKMILERLYDPMTHLVNNAITHGIETPEERLAAGKPREGTITVRAFYQGNQTVIYIADDGAGIHSDMVKEKAVKRGLVTPAEARAMTKLDVYELLFLPGFSTRDQADDFAGRGVGMDVVRTALSEIRGSVTIDSEMGKGTSFTIRLPLTLSISKALSCVNNQARIAFPMDGVEDMFDAPRERVQANDQGQSCILWRDTLLPFRPLSDLLQFNRTIGRGRVYGGHQDDDIISIVVLRSANTFIALEVDQVIGEQEIVIKQLEGPVPKPTGIAGATVLGDGRVMPIADVLELIDLSMGRVRRDPSVSLWSQSEDDLPPVPEAPAKAEPTVLIVDDSITVRELLSMSFNKVGYRVEQARDGQEAWEKLRSGLPCDLVFCDIEMPRMDGLELLSRMQKDSALVNIPIAMLTSRGADRHRQMAVDLGAKGYFTKPYLEEMLLDAAQRMLNGENMVGPRGS